MKILHTGKKNKLMIGQIETFEDSANAMLPRNNKRKHDDQSNIKSIRYFK